MKKLFVTITLTLLFTNAYAINNSCKEVNDDGLGTAFAVMNGLSYMKGIADVKKIEMKIDESLKDDFEKYFKFKCDEDKYNEVHEISLNYLLYRYTNQKNRNLNPEDIKVFSKNILAGVTELSKADFNKLVTCYVNNLTNNSKEYISRNLLKFEIIWDIHGYGWEDSFFKNTKDDELFSDELNSLWDKCYKY